MPSELPFKTSASLNTQQVIFWQQPFKVGGLTVTLLAGRVGLRLVGEADITSAEVLRNAIAALPPDPDEIHLQLSALDFIDVCAARELVCLASLPSQPQVILHYPPAVLTRLMQLLWPDVYDRALIKDERHTRTGRLRDPVPVVLRAGKAVDPACPLCARSKGQHRYFAGTHG